MTLQPTSDAAASANCAALPGDSILGAIPWAEVIAVGIRTTADGPLCDDVYWQFLLPDRCLEVPAVWVDSDALAVLHRRLPGLDAAKTLRAMCSTRERIFRIWHRDESQYVPSRDELRNRYRDLIVRLGGDAAGAAAAFDAIHAAWSADSRVYHGVEHLVDCLRELDSAPGGAAADLVELALWYHDLIYDPRARDNEERSAQALRRSAVPLGLPPQVANTAADLVRTTAHGEATLAPATPEAALIADIDLSIVGRDPLRFMDFEYGVEEEYRHVPQLWFHCRRGRLLASLLKRPHIFHTAAFRARYEQAARTQIAMLLATPRYRAYRWLRWLC